MHPKHSAVFTALIAVLSSAAHADSLPSDVRARHWAARAVRLSLRSGILRLESDRLFHGDSRVTRSEAAAAIARLGRLLTDGQWPGADKSVPVTNSVVPVLERTDWRTRPVRKYAFAAVLVRVADYAAKGVHRSPREAKVAQSEILKAPAADSIPSGPAHDALTYLAAHKMLQKDSPLLKSGAQPITGSELSTALAELVAGYNDSVTDIGHDADGSTPDDAFHKPQPKK